MEGLYIKLYEKYSKLKVAKDSQLDQINQDQEVKFVEYVSAAENLIKHLTNENMMLSATIDELRKEVVSLRSAKDEQFLNLQERLIEEQQKNQQLSAEMEHLRNLQQEKLCSRNRSDQPDKQQVNSNRASQFETDESPMRKTRKHARLFEDTGPATSSPAGGHVQLLLSREPSTDQSKRGVSLPACCQDSNVNGVIGKCIFQGLVECLISMKVSIADQPEGKCIRAVHQSSGYSFTLTWINKSDSDEEELLYHATSLGTFAAVAPDWMREAIIFSISMCPTFFERLSRVIQPH